MSKLEDVRSGRYEERGVLEIVLVFSGENGEKFTRRVRLTKGTNTQDVINNFIILLDSLVHSG